MASAPVPQPASFRDAALRHYQAIAFPGTWNYADPRILTPANIDRLLKPVWLTLGGPPV